ncbi:radical SAM protein [Mycobacterium sp.]|uniref:radical SAM protein n=1 Tax=Mycobacterium sp. TaxID=1785 RepID=UPI002C933376|nr:radical SAM protein [Mycobacterium sp.]HTY33958.1 radical SAM protein [Mycobacterium sp.]
MHLTKYLVRHRVGGNATVVVNTLSGAVDILTDDQVDVVERVANGETAEVDAPLIAYLRRRGYVFESAEAEEHAFSDLREKVRVLEQREPTVFAICPTYFCFFKCKYCYEGELTAPAHHTVVSAANLLHGMEALEAFLRRNLALRERPYVTFLGGEPLVPAARDTVLEVMRAGADRGFRFTVITNGYLLDTFIGDLQRYRSFLKYVQVTLDGPEDVHNRRRPLRNDGDTFRRISANVQLALEAGLPVQLRTNVDDSNVRTLPGLGRFIRERSWPGFRNFRTYLAPTEDSTCLGLIGLPREDQLLASWLALREDPRHAHDLSVFDDSKLFRTTSMVQAVLSGSDTLVLPRFSYCAATKGKAFVFGPEGTIYQCLRGVGDERTAVGTYFPHFEIDLDRVHNWMSRDISAIHCPSCTPVATLHGGGCALEALHRKGDLKACNCGDSREVVVGFLESRKDRILMRARAGHNTGPSVS